MGMAIPYQTHNYFVHLHPKPSTFSTHIFEFVILTTYTKQQMTTNYHLIYHVIKNINLEHFVTNDDYYEKPEIQNICTFVFNRKQAFMLTKCTSLYLLSILQVHICLKTSDNC